MTLLGNKFWIMRFHQNVDYLPTIDGPTVTAAKNLTPDILKALDLKPRTFDITRPSEPLRPMIKSVKDLTQDTTRVKDLKPRITDVDEE